MSLIRATAVIVVLALASCSTVFVQGGTGREGTRARTAPVIDTVVAGLALLYAAAGIALVVGCNNGAIERCDGLEVIPVVLGTAGTLTFGPSASSGYLKTRRCRAAHEPVPPIDLTPAPVAGTPCPAGGAGVRRCAARLVCAAGICAVPLSEGEGGACAPIAGAARGGTCPAGLRCADDVCVRQ